MKKLKIVLPILLLTTFSITSCGNGDLTTSSNTTSETISSVQTEQTDPSSNSVLSETTSEEDLTTSETTEPVSEVTSESTSQNGGEVVSTSETTSEDNSSEGTTSETTSQNEEIVSSTSETTEITTSEETTELSTSEETTSEDSGVDLSPIQAIASDLEASNVTLNVYTNINENNASNAIFSINNQYMKMEIQVYGDASGNAEQYYIIKNNVINCFMLFNGSYMNVSSVDTDATSFTLDYVMNQHTKDSFKELFMNVNPDSVTYVGGAYHVDEIILHIDGVSLAKQAHYESEVLNDGLEWPLTDVSFTIENNHIKTLSYTQSPITLDRESGMIVISDKPSTQTITFSNFGTTTFDIPEEITAMLE